MQLRILRRMLGPRSFPTSYGLERKLLFRDFFHVPRSESPALPACIPPLFLLVVFVTGWESPR